VPPVRGRQTRCGDRRGESQTQPRLVHEIRGCERVARAFGRQQTRGSAATRYTRGNRRSPAPASPACIAAS
jgi:hypothetical protein